MTDVSPGNPPVGGPTINLNLNQVVNVDDLSPTTENGPPAPLPDDLPSYANYMGKL